MAKPLSVVLTLAKLAVSAGILWVIFSGIDTQGLWARLDRDVALVGGVALVLLQIQALGGGWRWTLVLRAHDRRVGFAQAWRNVLLGLFVNQAMPSTIGGDTVRVWNGTRLGLPLGLAARSVVVDRVCSFLGLILLCALGLPALRRQASDPLVAAGLTTLVIGGLCCLGALLALRFLPGAVARARGVAPFVALSRSAWSVLLGRTTALPILGLLLFPHVIDILVVWLFAGAIGSPATLWQIALVFPPAILVAAVPLSIAGWGLREGALVLGFAIIGLPADQAVTVSLLYGLSAVITGVIGGAIWALGDRDGLGALRRGGREALAETRAPAAREKDAQSGG
ncbi:lysylphosphatidylglycerol synthase transmembrane domain-containing protein [Rhodospirillum rubrum]|uniref:Flippase-like domain-containing protein n=1 Tax=Rhodospirillum rubrum (strain ATCC 11170 / ATH 1.1.1 / DSM 467 / LMG 4362 / NCIMB 8255 / S1) TaxID=269796 RepID=Q2RQB9_RHORT|nr:lysylphosphatidylglycerol synthase transmembrane domain-containing protein [Rhodospirillum rubrum]ABC23676.1 conserved hypothetical protein [Rhodospirillum rubrum ATCC 11170]AEO49414.1 hypothetical protein F11_14760 [Rhodospirillum rubrum F11]MBK5955352.1 lysylphosphatidylglycerol synthetase family protein [Rhodospirillum rubrum]QXG79636.1 flippase-like domain-containing protein [Rhodospirillum rubrum]HAQ00061.1 UPF0104 family protein [Rhodospirillum rubrum]